MPWYFIFYCMIIQIFPSQNLDNSLQPELKAGMIPNRVARIFSLIAFFFNNLVASTKKQIKLKSWENEDMQTF